MFILFKKRILEISYSWKPIHFPSPVEIGEKGRGDRSVFAIDRSRKWVAESKATDTGRNQPERESLSSPFVPFPSRWWMPPSTTTTFPFLPSPPPPFLLRHRHPLLSLLYVSSRCDRDSKRRIGLVIFAPAAQGGGVGGQAGTGRCARSSVTSALCH